MSPQKEPISKRLKRLRDGRKLTVKQIAALIGVSPSTYREWEYGRAIQGEPYPRLAEAFGVSLHYLITGEDPSDPRTVQAQIQLIERMFESLKANLAMGAQATQRKDRSNS